jgi:hypothetical protein
LECAVDFCCQPQIHCGILHTAQFLPLEERNNDALTKIAAMLLSMYITANIEECVERREEKSALKILVRLSPGPERNSPPQMRRPGEHQPPQLQSFECDYLGIPVVYDRPARTKDCRNMINCWETIGLRGIIKVVRKVKVVGVVCVVVEAKGPAERERERESRDSACLFTDNQPTAAILGVGTGFRTLKLRLAFKLTANKGRA